MTEQQQHLMNLAQQRQTLSQELVGLNAKINERKELLLKVQGAIEYLNQIGVTLPETEDQVEDGEETES
jgi:prefoldin subunit 5